MRILVAGTVYYPAMHGQAIFTENLTVGLARRGHQVLSVYPSEKGESYSAVRDNVRLEGIKSISLTSIHPDAYFSIFSESAIRQIFRDFKPEIVHIQDHYPLSRDVLQVAKQYGIHTIGTNHFMPENLAPYVPFASKIKPLFNKVMWSFVLGAYNQLDVATAQSKASATLLRDQGLRVPVFPVSCGISIDRFHPIPDLDRMAFRARYGIAQDKTVFLFVGRVDHEKRIDVLLKAVKLLGRDDIQLVIAGRGAEMQHLQAEAAQLELGNRVHFTGYVPTEDLPALFNSADIFCMPSEAELLSIATLEAMACGLPVLLANAVALPELVKNGANGYLFKPGDPVDAAHRMAQLADHPERWARMGIGSQEKANFHSLENSLKQYEYLYNNLLAGTYSYPFETGINKLRSSPEWLSGNKK